MNLKIYTKSSLFPCEKKLLALLQKGGVKIVLINKNETPVEVEERSSTSFYFLFDKTKPK